MEIPPSTVCVAARKGKLTVLLNSVLATKANPIASLIGTSHEKLILWHIWIAWAMFVLALIHTFPFIVYNIREGDIVTQWNSGGVWVTGVIALLAQAWLTFMSIRWLRFLYNYFPTPRK